MIATGNIPTDIVPIAEAVKQLPAAFHLQRRTVVKWGTRGVRGRKLKLWRLGGRHFVRPQDLMDFLRAGNEETRDNKS